MLARPVARGGNYNKGEGIEMAMAIGAATAGNFSLFHAEPVDPRSRRARGRDLGFPYGILVNVDGERFVDEARGPIDAWYERTTRDIQAQPRGIAWMILDAAGAQAIPNLQHGDPHRVAAGPRRHDRRPGRPRSSVDPDALEATVAAVQRRLPGRRVGPDPHPTGWRPTGVDAAEVQLGQADQPGPFDRLPDHGANVFTFGGLKIDATSPGRRPRRARHPRPLRRG